MVCPRESHGNRETIAKALAEILHREMRKRREVEVNDLPKCSFIGLDSEICFFKHHGQLLGLVYRLSALSTQTLPFSARELSPVTQYWPLKKKLLERVREPTMWKNFPAEHLAESDSSSSLVGQAEVSPISIT